MSGLIRVPVDIDREDRLIAGLTARQLLILGITGLALYALYQLTAVIVSPLIYVATTIPIVVVVVIIVIGRRDGVSLDRLLISALRFRLSPRTHVAAPSGLQSAPQWLTERATPTAQQARTSLKSLDLPAQSVRETGIVDLGSDGLALIAQCSTINFELRTPAEQETYVGIFAQFLHTLTQPIQVVIRTERLDLAPQISDIRAAADLLPHPALARSAREHADYLEQLASNTDLLRRQVLLVFREPLHSMPSTAYHRGGSSLAFLTKYRRHNRDIDDAARQAAESRLVRRVQDAMDILATAGITVTSLDSRQATAVLSAACNPGSLIPTTGRIAATNDIITTESHDETLVTDTCTDNVLKHDGNAFPWPEYEDGAIHSELRD